jgi:cytochrome c-type biogenesis protein CcmH
MRSHHYRRGVLSLVISPRNPRFSPSPRVERGPGGEVNQSTYPGSILNLSQPALPRLIGMSLAVLAVLMLFSTANVAPVAAQGEFPLPPGVTWDDVNRVASKMYCDVCEGIPLDECESIACRQWREEIARQLSEGRTEDEIIDYFVERYGNDVSAIPRDKSDRFLVFAVPIVLALLLGAAGAVQVNNLRRRGQQAGQVTRRSAGRLQRRPVPDDVEPDYLERLENELQGLES